MIDFSVVVPVYNEEESLPHLVTKIHTVCAATGKTYEIILIDDGSEDGTWDQMRAAHEAYPCFRLFRFRRNFGQTAAMSCGFTESKGRTVVTLDADLQNDPEDIPMLLAKADEGYDVVSGWRKHRRDPFINRKLPSMIANALISKITGVHLHDYGCTLKAYNHEVVKSLRLYGDMHRFIPAMASWVGGKVTEVPVRHHARQFGKSKYGISRTFRVVLDLLTVKFLLRYSTHPIQMFGKIGMIFGIPGFLMLLSMGMAHFAFNVCGAAWLAPFIDVVKRPFWIITPFMLVLFCIQFVTMGLLAEIQIRTYHESQHKATYVLKETLS